MSKISDKIMPDMIPVVKGMVSSKLDFHKGNKELVVILDNSGKMRYSKGNPTAPMSQDELVAELMATLPSAFKAQGVNKGTVPAKGGSQMSASSHAGKSFKTAEDYRNYRISLPKEERTKLDKIYRKQFGLG